MKQFILLPQQRQQQRRMKFQLLLLLVLVSPNRQVRRPTIECLVAIVPRAEADFLELLQSSFSQPVVLSLSPFNAARGKSSTDDCTREGEGDGGRSEDDSSACQFREKADLRLTWQCRRSRLPLGFYLSAYMDHSLTPLLTHLRFFFKTPTTRRIRTRRGVHLQTNVLSFGGAVAAAAGERLRRIYLRGNLPTARVPLHLHPHTHLREQVELLPTLCCSLIHYVSHTSLSLSLSHTHTHTHIQDTKAHIVWQIDWDCFFCFCLQRRTARSCFLEKYFDKKTEEMIVSNLRRSKQWFGDDDRGDDDIQQCGQML